MKTTSPSPRARLRPIIFSLSLIFTLLASGTANAQFADVPVYLQNETKTIGGTSKVKPNVMLFIDDSGSMRYVTGKDVVAGKNEKSRMSIAKSALSSVVTKYKDQINWNLQTLNNNKSVNMDQYTDNWELVLKKINKMQSEGGTPTTPRFYELSKIVRDNTEYRCQKNFILLMSDGDANYSQDTDDSNWTFVQDRGWTIKDKSKIKPYFPNNTVDDPYFGRQTGGGAAYESRYNSSTNSWGIDLWDTFWDRENGLGWFSRTLATKDFKTGGTDKTGKSWDGDSADPKNSNDESIYKKQIAETFTIGFGEGLTEKGRAYLKQGAARANAADNEKSFFNASNEEELVAAIGSIFDSIESSALNNAEEGVGTSAPAVSGANGRATDAATVYLDPQSWSSQLHFYSLNADGSFSSTPKQPYFGNRKTLINTGSGVFWADGQSYADNGYFGIETSGKNADEWKSALMPWTVRSKDDSVIKTDSVNTPYSQTYRDRNLDAEGKPVNGKRDLGDILDSGIATAGNSVNGRPEFLLTAANDGMVHLFRSYDHAEHPYELKLSYIPAGMERDSGNGGSTLGETLKELADEGYGQSKPHRYMVNGGFVVRTTAAPSGGVKGQQTVMFGAMGQGGRGAYALNVGGTDRVNGTAAIGLNAADNAWNTTVPLFETAKGESNTLGYTVGTPQIGRVSIKRPAPTDAVQQVDISENVRYAAFLASGYRNQDIKHESNETALYVYDLLGQEASTGEVKGKTAGSLIAKITVPGGVGGLSSPTLLDMDFDGVIDVAYAGDYGGNMYRFDLRGETPDKWRVQRIYTGSAARPITAAPAVSRRADNKYVVIFGTGSDIYQSDAASKTQQAVFGIFEDLKLNGDNTLPEVTAATEADLQTQTMEEKEIDGKKYRFLSSHPVGSDKKGWKINLGVGTDNAGERVVVKPTMLLRSALISTRIYQTTTTPRDNGDDVCLPDETSTSTESSSWSLMVNAETGGSLKKTDTRINFIDKSGNAVMNNGNYANGLRQSGIYGLASVEPSKLSADSPVTLDGDSGGNGTDSAGRQAVPKNTCFKGRAERFILNAKGEKYSVVGKYCGVQRISWREIF
ncbi:PilC family type IV pilus tip adhesin [Neisseria sp.]|uniref:PilC family type IV pilus tip adhesin n=1 Tax=Neisseria sp. TaxID=192066 RepID=UPI0026DD6DC6|nr:PilC family type IV pilus tip adhesin [Neisseria sp.]MDO4907463.1 PilC family type IV pilus tip adhesin [Neisseria sp.]